MTHPSGALFDRARPPRARARATILALALAMTAALGLPGTTQADAQELEPDRQYPFACTTERAGLGQPIVDNQDGDGVTVYVEDEDGTYDPETSDVAGYSRDCDADTRTWYIAIDTEGERHVVRDHGEDAPESLEAALPEGVEVATTELIDVDGASEVPYLVRHERGVINRFIYSISMLAPVDEVLDGSPDAPDDSLWNGRLLYQFQGGVGIGFSQGGFSEGRAVTGSPDRLGKGYAVVYSTATSTSDHYNLLLGGRTAQQVKDHFVASFGEPRYTVGVGGSGGAIQQYVYNQNHPDLLDAAIPQRSYPDMTTQTIHVGDCSLLDRWMDIDRSDDPTWQDWDNREWIQGLNSIEGYLGSTGAQLAQIQQALGQTPQSGTSECLEGWFGLAPLAMNPEYGSETNWHLLGDQVDGIERNHWSDAREAYGTDLDTGYARVPWDNVGVQYGLKAVADGRITPEQFLDLNARVGSWKDTEDMVQEGFPFVGSIEDLQSGEVTYDPWSMRNQNLSPDDGTTPAPRRSGDLTAIENAYTSGLITLGAPAREIPIIEARDHLEHVLDMHNSHQSFASRQRFLEAQGHADNQVIWWLETDEEGESPFVTDFYHHAFDTIAEWIGNLEDDPTATVADARPTDAVDRCFEVDGTDMARGEGVWDGVLDDGPEGACTERFEIHSTSRIEAGGPISGDVYKCRTMPVASALNEGLYGDWDVDAAALERLEQIHPEGVCDYGLRGVGDPRSDVPDGVDATGGAARITVSGADDGATVQVRQHGQGVATAVADGDGAAVVTGLPAGEYVVAQEVDGQRSTLSAPVTVTGVTFPDVPEGSTHEPAITRLAGAELLRGFPDGTFGPALSITRAQSASLLAAVLGLEPIATGPFTDVPEGTVHAGAINALHDRGIVDGTTATTFEPGRAVTRGQLASMVAAAAQLDGGQHEFSDVAGTTHEPGIAAVATAELMGGYTDGTFRPHSDITRAQTASVAARLLDLLGSAG